jgi:hypothetical protein
MSPLLTDEQLDDIRRGIDDGPQSSRYDMRPLQTSAEVFGYCIEVARREGWDEVEVVDALLKVVPLYREDARAVGRTLASLGYTVSDQVLKAARRLPARPPEHRPPWRYAHASSVPRD